MIVTRRIPIILVLVVLLAGIWSGCDSQTDDSVNDAPKELSSEIFALETSLFSPIGGKSAESGVNFFSAAIRVWPVSLILGANIVVPAAITQAALQVEPTFSAGVWTWSRTTLVDDHSFQFDLTGEPNGSSVDWSMIISASNPYLGQDYNAFELFRGTTSADGSSASWQLYYKVEGERTNVLNGSFNRSDDDSWQLTFQIPLSAPEHGGDSVSYNVDGLTRRFTWIQVGEGLVHNIVWNSFTKEGSIEADNFLSGTRACWDSYLDDTPCP